MQTIVNVNELEKSYGSAQVINCCSCSLIIVCLLAYSITISPNNIIWVMLAMSTIFVVIANHMYHVCKSN